MSCHPSLWFAVVLAGLVTACGPTFNWRDRTIDATTLTALFPCKPETMTRSVSIANTDRDMAMRSCDAGGVNFAVAHARVSDPVQVPMVLADWRAATLAGLHADPAAVSSHPPAGLPALPQVLVLRAAAAPSERPPRALIGVWFAQGADVFAAFVMAPTIPNEVVEPFFSGLRLR